MPSNIYWAVVPFSHSRNKAAVAAADEEQIGQTGCTTFGVAGPGGDVAVSIDQIGLFDVQVAIASDFPIGGFQIITTGTLESFLSCCARST